MKKILLPIILLSFVLANQKSFAHCEVPCGIYGDELRIALLYEHFATIEKAMQKIEELSSEGEKNYNQIVRWVTTKEDHAKEIQHIANQYFLTQRVKPVDEKDAEKYAKYQEQLSLLHHIIVYSMKAKQTTDVKYVEHLRTTLAQFEEVYFEGKHRHKIEQHDH